MMDEQRPAEAHPQTPGTYRWDGRELRPVRGPGAGRIALVVAGVIVAFLVGLLAGHAGASSSQTIATTPTAPAQSIAPAPAPTPVTLSGQGSKVLPVDLQAGRYRLSWSAQGRDNFIVHLLGDNDVSLVNEIPPDPAAGETVVQVRDAGSYTLQVEAATLSWSITLTRL